MCGIRRGVGLDGRYATVGCTKSIPMMYGKAGYSISISAGARTFAS